MSSFEVVMVISVDSDSSILGSDPDNHAEDVEDVIKDTIYDLDDITIEEIFVKEC